MKKLATPIQGFQSLRGAIFSTEADAEKDSINELLVKCAGEAIDQRGNVHWSIFYEELHKTFTLTLKEPQ